MKRRRRIKRSVRLAIAGILLIVLGSSLASFIRHQIDGTKPLAGSVQDGNKSAADGEDPPDNVYRIVIDPGHGGKDPGSEGSGGSREKDSNLSLALKVYDLLKKDPAFAPRMTRSDDTFVELSDRAGAANDWDADVLLSIHGNAFEDPSIGGTETYYRYDNGIPLAEAIHRKVVEAMGFPDRGVKEEHLKVLSLSNMPAVLIEPGYLTNPGEESVLLSEDGQMKAAQAIADGLKSYLQANGQSAGSSDELSSER
ncbi:N-acetylmuramoyl-L-alanine amidase family protein [Paenibacillus sacheonensis]|uniref:N-acetylmuramoyl-L-alanine amidase n=1 Tax=Paenibacillus sacheonensis TaxID=742054 RepID=A0A7X4YR69_9BACL|nr:N-acetylmuramoyl-L-alanine amidase [Paenibacillus sacheonensis]MBM7563655.1 N-acetylmuramoyl-L-alanine amidase [Paenibacillus sacheonensis]NBC71051.1 N-acetylmuramoyl-L-alanine amidase [Paenibacillus sacheonensis]